MGDLFGGQFNSEDFYGLDGFGDDPVDSPVVSLGPVAPDAGSAGSVSWLQNLLTAGSAPILDQKFSVGIPDIGQSSPVYGPPVAPVYGPPEASFEQWLNTISSTVDTALDLPLPGAKIEDYRSVPPPNYGMKAPTVAPIVARQAASASVPDKIANVVSSAYSDIGNAFANIFSSGPAPAAQSGSPASAPKSGPVAVARNQRSAAQSGRQQTSFTQDLNSVVGTITGAVASIFGPAMARKQQVTQTQRAGARGDTGGKGPAGGAGKDDTKTYLYIGGGALLLAGLVYMVSKD